MSIWRVRRQPPRTLAEFRTRLDRACDDSWLLDSSEDEEITVLKASFDAAAAGRNLIETMSTDDLSGFIGDMTVYFVQSSYADRYTVLERKVLAVMFERRLRRFAGLQYVQAVA